MTETAIIHCEGEGSQYVVMATRIDPSQHEAFANSGFRSPWTQYVAWTMSGSCWTATDKYELKRTMPGDNSWLLDELENVDAYLRQEVDA